MTQLHRRICCRRICRRERRKLCCWRCFRCRFCIRQWQQFRCRVCRCHRYNWRRRRRQRICICKRRFCFCVGGGGRLCCFRCCRRGSRLCCSERLGYLLNHSFLEVSTQNSMPLHACLDHSGGEIVHGMSNESSRRTTKCFYTAQLVGRRPHPQPLPHPLSAARHPLWPPPLPPPARAHRPPPPHRLVPGPLQAHPQVRAAAALLKDTSDGRLVPGLSAHGWCMKDRHPLLETCKTQAS